MRKDPIMCLIDTTTKNLMFQMTAEILEQIFFFDEEMVGRFLNKVLFKIDCEYTLLVQTGDTDTLFYLKHNYLGRSRFTKYLVSFYLFDTLEHDFFFNEREMQIFDNLLPKLNGDGYAKQRDERAYY